MRISDWSSDVCSSDLGSVSVSIARLRATACATTRWSRSAAVRSVTPCSRSSASAARLNTASATSISIKVKPFSAERLQKVKPFSAERRQERSEEHTSELQSLMRTSYAVFCLTKKINYQSTNTIEYIS